MSEVTCTSSVARFLNEANPWVQLLVNLVGGVVTFAACNFASQAELSALRQEVAARDTRLNAVDRYVRSLQVEIGALQKKFDEAGGDLQLTREEVDQLKQAVTASANQPDVGMLAEVRAAEERAAQVEAKLAAIENRFATSGSPWRVLAVVLMTAVLLTITTALAASRGLRDRCRIGWLRGRTTLSTTLSAFRQRF